eukprot:PITA_22948
MNVDGSIEKLKARLVAKGYSQREGIDFDYTFAPVANLNTIRMVIALATKYNWELHELDVKSAFLNGELKEEIYLAQPERFVKQVQEHLVCILKKDLYGLKQALRSWYEKVDSFFLEYGFHRSLNDPNLYTKHNKQGHIILISLYVDDMIITGDVDDLIRGIKRLMAQVFDMKDLGSLHYCLGLEVCKEPGQTFLTQGKQLVGILIYLTTTRPNLAYSVSVLSKFMSKPLESHWVAAKSVLRYLCDTVSCDILYADASDVSLAVFSDSDYAGNLDDRRSITGYAFNIGSGVITWSSKKQSTVVVSSCEAKYQALCAATCEAI